MADDVSLANRVRSTIEDAFDENVKNAAMSEWFKLSGKVNSVDELMKGFDVALNQVKELRERQLTEAERVFGKPT
jgi:hypothetical protein